MTFKTYIVITKSMMRLN